MRGEELIHKKLNCLVWEVPDVPSSELLPGGEAQHIQETELGFQKIKMLVDDLFEKEK